jgi:hypothetical protein
MGVISVAAFNPHEGKEEELLRVIGDRLPLLRRLGLATDRESIMMKSTGGAVIEVSEWASWEAIEKAHQTPEVLELWQRFDACSKYVPLSTLPECKEDFASFKVV